MKGIQSWSFYPFVPLNHPEKVLLPFVSRISPIRSGFTFDWIDNGDQGLHDVILSLREGDVIETKEDETGSVRFEGLADDTDYRFTVKRRDGSASVTRLVRTGDYLGDTVINYLHPDDDTYAFSGKCLCSPSILKLPSGKLLAAMDVYVGNGPQNLSLVFASEDNGITWKWQCDLYPCFWPRLFLHKGRVYIIACQTEYGDLLIGASDDEGKSWSAPSHLLPGTNFKFGNHKNPVPVTEIQGRLYTAVEYGSWSMGYHDMGLMSASVNDDLLEPDSWSFAGYVHYDPQWPGAPENSGLGKASAGAGIEGSAVEKPDGSVAVLYRMDIGGSVPDHGLSCMLRAEDDPEAPLAFDSFVSLPVGSNSKFTLRKDDRTGKYVAVGTLQDNSSQRRTRLAMCVSDDLISWNVASVLFDIRSLDPQMNGLQYPDWIADGDDMLLAIRTALHKPRNFHDSNAITFKRIVDFRTYFDGHISDPLIKL